MKAKIILFVCWMLLQSTFGYAQAVPNNPYLFSIENESFKPFSFAFAWPENSGKNMRLKGWYNVAPLETRTINLGVPYNQLYYFCQTDNNSTFDGNDLDLNIDRTKGFDWTDTVTLGTAVGFKALKDTIINVYDLENYFTSSYILLRNNSNSDKKCVIALKFKGEDDFLLIGTYTLKPGETRNMNFEKTVEDLLTYWEDDGHSYTWKRWHPSTKGMFPEDPWSPTRFFYIGEYGTGFKYYSQASTGKRNKLFYSETQSFGKYQSIFPSE